MSCDTLRKSLDAMRCPITRQRLTLLSKSETETIDREVEAWKRLHRGGAEVLGRLTAAIGTEDRRFVYRVEDDIVWMVPELAVVPAEESNADALTPEKRDVQAFYDDFGWVKDDAGVFNDTAAFTDIRTIARDYREACNARIMKRLSGGRFLLDVASGAIPHPEYLKFSAGYETRVCVDLSIRALREARRQLGDHGLYLLADISRLPLADSGMDDVISLHTIYHLPPTEQAPAIDELVRVTQPGGRAVVVYVWSHSVAMSVAFAIRSFLGRVRRLGRKPQFPSAGPNVKEEARALYFQPQDHDWFVREVARRYSVKLRVWSAVSTAFQKRFVPEGRSGRMVIGLVKLLESAFPGIAGRVGTYPMFVIQRPKT